MMTMSFMVIMMDDVWDYVGRFAFYSVECRVLERFPVPWLVVC
jgi:hypothetical protein